MDLDRAEVGRDGVHLVLPVLQVRVSHQVRVDPRLEVCFPRSGELLGQVLILIHQGS